jgi:putative FmdB family regulatory protein
MPIYEFKCIKCGRVQEYYLKPHEIKKKRRCDMCFGKLAQVFSVFTPKTYNEDCVRDLQHEPVRIGRKQDITDAINRFNDSELASKQGKVSADLY